MLIPHVSEWNKRTESLISLADLTEMILEKSSNILIHVVDIRFAFLSTKINSVSIYLCIRLLTVITDLT